MIPFRAIHNWWSKFTANVLPGNLRPGTQIPLLVEDPRLFRAQPRTGIPTNVQRPSSVCRQVQPPPITSNNLMWDWQEFQEHFLPRRFSHADFERFCSGRLAFPQRTDFKVVVIQFKNNNNELRCRLWSWLIPQIIQIEQIPFLQIAFASFALQRWFVCLAIPFTATSICSPMTSGWPFNLQTFGQLDCMTRRHWILRAV